MFVSSRPRPEPALPDEEPGNPRRTFVLGLVSAAAGLVIPRSALAGTREERVLSFVHTHTSERLTVPYFGDGTYLPDGLARLNAFLEDFRTREQHEIDPGLFDILNDLRLTTGAKAPFHVISAYRSPQTNAALRATSGGVAAGSLHQKGQAIDVRLPDVSSAVLRDAAIELQRGGVGYYRSSDFVHVDTGRVRRW